MRPATTILKRSTALVRQHAFSSCSLATTTSNPGAVTSALRVGIPRRPGAAIFSNPSCLNCQYPPLFPHRRFSGNNGPLRDASSQTPPPPQPPPDASLKDLPSEAEKRRSEISKRFSATMDDLQNAAFTAGKRLNDLTGYSGIEALKKSIEDQEAHVRASRNEVKAAKEAYQAAINRRSASQREVNELLQRKHAWSPSDLERFTSLYRSDHANEQEEAAAQERLSKAEQAAEEAQTRLARSILTRYHEEQIWSDKIRRASTWGTWGLMGFNVFLFIVVQLGLEPWKRRRLVGGFEEKVREVIQEEGLRNALLRLETSAGRGAGTVLDPESILSAAEVSEATEIVELKAESGQPVVEEHVAMEDGQVFVENPDEEVPSRLAATLAEAERQIGLDTEAIREKWRGLWSDQVIELRRIQLTTVAVQSAAVGAIITSIIAFLANR